MIVLYPCYSTESSIQHFESFTRKSSPYNSGAFPLVRRQPLPNNNHFSSSCLFSARHICEKFHSLALTRDLNETYNTQRRGRPNVYESDVVAAF